MTRRKVVQNSKPPQPLSSYVQNSSTPLTLAVNIQTNRAPPLQGNIILG